MIDEALAPVCGLYCRSCQYFENQCQGCGHAKGKPFWTTQMKDKICPLYNCCINQKQLEHCGLCNEFSCEIFMTLRDPSLTEEEVEKALLNRQNELIRRREIGTEKWLEEKS